MGARRRKDLPRRKHATWDPSLRQHDPLALLAASMGSRVPELVTLKYQMMRLSPFSFFRGAVPVMAADLAVQPHTGILNQICGDAHVRNLGAYMASDGRMVFDINDFDETIRAPFEWDLKRLATSLVLAGRESGSGESACRNAVTEFTSAYARLMRCLSEATVLEVARYQVHRLGRVATISEVLMKAQRATPLRSLDALTRPAVEGDVLLEGVSFKEGLRVFSELPGPVKDGPPMLRRATVDEALAVLASLAEYRKTLLPERRHFLDQYRVLDVGFKIVGTGSVGLRDYVVYLEGNGAKDPLFLQVKQEARSGWADYVGHEAAGGEASPHEGRRVAEGQRAMQFQSDPFLGWTEVRDAQSPETGRPYLVRQLNDHKASLAVEDLKGTGLVEYGRICGELLARGHARSGDAVVLSGYLGRGRILGAALASFANRYADQTEQDWKLLCDSPLGGHAKAAKPSVKAGRGGGSKRATPKRAKRAPAKGGRVKAGK